jgi:hypothetical protein
MSLGLILVIILVILLLGGFSGRFYREPAEAHGSYRR